MSRPAALPMEPEARAVVLELEARQEPCAIPDCAGTLCYRRCCYPPRDYYGALRSAWCHAHLHAAEPVSWRHTCPTCGQRVPQ